MSSPDYVPDRSNSLDSLQERQLLELLRQQGLLKQELLQYQQQYITYNGYRFLVNDVQQNFSKANDINYTFSLVPDTSVATWGAPNSYNMNVTPEWSYEPFRSEVEDRKPAKPIEPETGMGTSAYDILRGGSSDRPGSQSERNWGSGDDLFYW